MSLYVSCSSKPILLCRIPGVELSDGQGPGQLLLPEEGVDRKPPVQRLQPHHSGVQVSGRCGGSSASASEDPN